LLLIDATYKLNILNLTVLLQLIVDGHGESEIVSVFLLTSEDGQTISGLLDILKRHNPAWNKIQTVLISQKELSTSSIIHKSQKMSIILEQKNFALEIIQKLAYKANIDEYKENPDALKDADIPPVYQYYMEWWDGIKEEWVVGLKQSFHYNNHKNNYKSKI